MPIPTTDTPICRQVISHRPPAERRRLRAELVAIAITVAGKFVMMDILPAGRIYRLVASLGWIVYIVARLGRDPTLTRRWGLARRTAVDGFKATVPLGVPVLAVMVAFGLFSGRAVVNRNMVALLLLYPLWGLVQQFLLVAVAAANLELAGAGRLPRTALVLIVATGFACVHLPRLDLVVSTFGLAVFTATVFLRTRSLWAIGVYHGWFATVLFYFVLGEDLWAVLT